VATGTQVDVVMPQMGVSVSEGTITRWLKQPGEPIAADEPLLEISTDKVDTEVPSPGSGVLQQILVQEGETVEVGTRLAVIAPEGAAPAPEPVAAEPPPAAAPEPVAAPEPEPAPAPEPVAAAPEPAPAPAGNGDLGKSFVSPVVARIAGEHGVDVSKVPGTGRDGRVTKKDILAFVESGPPPAPVPAEPVAPPAPEPQAPPPAEAPVAASPQPEAAAGETLEPMSAMRKGIAEHMRRSLDTSAHVTSAIEVDMSKVVAIREKVKREYQQAYGVNATYLAFIARATIETLREYPYVNGEIRGDQIVTRNYVNLGIAVELADGKGLIVPVITNPGGYGTFHGTPVISQPQAAILGTYAIVKRAWVVQDELGNDVIAIRPIMNITLTYDHRLVDGALAGRFLRDLRERLESWDETAFQS